MWTPRRILILLATLFAFGGVYAAYARFLGRIDGLPNLPAKYLEVTDKALPEIRQGESPTIARLRMAFGDNCPEMGAAYPTRLEIRESGIVFAAGMPQIGSEPTKFVRLSPLSVALFGKAKPKHEQLPGEALEISTLHSDEGILEFDRAISSDRDMLSGKAKLIAIEMRSNPDPHVTDPRNSRILITNNQRYADPGRGLVMKTAGPLYYRTPDHPDATNPSQPQVWTNASVEIVNKDNLPRPLHGTALPVVAVNNDETVSTVVAEMSLGLHTSPPTVTADGMDLFMKRDPKGKGYAGLREMVLKENVLFSLWLDGSSGFPGSEPKGKAKAEPTIAITALMGGGADGLATAERLKSKTLLRIRTLGKFRQNTETNLATFEVSPQANPLLPNNVDVTRHLPGGGKDFLVCQKLDIEFNGTVVGEKSSSNGFKKLEATGSHVLIAAASEALQAQGTALKYETDAVKKTTVTTLTGAPLSAVRGRNVLMAGSGAVPGILRFENAETAKGKHTDIEILGPGRIEMFDEATNEKNLIAVWKTKLVQTRETIDSVALDRFDFLGDGEFIDAKGEFRLKGDTLKLWLKPGDTAVKDSKSKPFRLQSLGHVEGTSADAIIDNTDQLLVMFADLPPAPAVVNPALPPAMPTTPAPAPAAEVKGRQPQPAMKPNPVRMSARKIDVWVNRDLGGKYDLNEARCDDRVVVLQAPNDPKKFAVGVDIRGGSLNMKKHGSGHVMQVNGTGDVIARVRFENTTICGPTVVIDQPANLVKVTGGGWMKMPSSSDLAGSAIKEKAEITVHWTEKMNFFGERRSARFFGGVQAVQAPAEDAVSLASTSTRSNITCHEMSVTFDRPFFFSTRREQQKKEGDPKVESVECTPAPQDEKSGSQYVVYLEETIDRATKKILRAQQIEAKLLRAEIDAAKNTSTIHGFGPGITRMLAMGDKETTPTSAPQPTTKKEIEMKLTVVRYSGRLDLKDKKGHYQEAVFREGVRVVQVPSENLQLKVDETAALPPRSMMLRCNETFTVSSHRAVAGGEETKTMEAVDGAVVQTDDYHGTGHTISFDGTQVILKGFGDGQATIYRRNRGLEDRDYKSGNPLIYNTKTGQISGAQSTGGQFTAPK